MNAPTTLSEGDVGHELHHEQIHALLNQVDAPFEVAPIGVGPTADRPAAGQEGRYWLTTDTVLLYIDDGSEWQLVTAGERYDVRRFGVDGSGDETSAIQAVIDQCESDGGGTVYQPITCAISGSGLTIPETVNYVQEGGVELVYTGTGVAVTFLGLRGGICTLAVRRASITWQTGVDTSSVGIRITNSEDTLFTIPHVYGFHWGIDFLGNANLTAGSDAGTQVQVLLGRVYDNKIGLKFRGDSNAGDVGYANALVIQGGHIRITNASNYAGSRYIDLSEYEVGTGGNGITFIGTNVEGLAPEKNVEIGNSFNRFINCRWESIRSLHLLSTSEANYIDGGYGNYGPGTSTFTDDGTGNKIEGSRGGIDYGDSAGGTPLNGGMAARELWSLSSAADVMLRVRRLSGETAAEILAGGIMQLFASGVAAARVKLDPTSGTGPGGYGGLFVGRDAGVDASWGRGNTNTPTFEASCAIKSARGATGARPSAAAVGAGAQWYDTTLSKPIWSDGAAWRDAMANLV